MKPTSAFLAALIAALAATSLHSQNTPADTLRLSAGDAVERALDAGDEIRLAAAGVDVADAQILAARAAGLPQLRLASTYQHVLENARAQAVGSIFGQSNTYNSNVVLSQSLFQGGRVFAASRAARQTGDAARLTAREIEAQLIVDVQRAYLASILADRLAGIQDSGLALATARLAQVEQLQSAGRAARFDVLSARVQRANLEPVAIRARNDRELALLELKRLLNIPVGQPIALTTLIDSASVVAALPSAADSPAAAAVDDRAAVRSAELLAGARNDGIRVARADLLPTVSVSGQLGYLAFPNGGFLENVPTRGGGQIGIACPPDSPDGRLCTQQNGGWFSDRSVGIQVSWPLFDGMRTRANINLAQAQARVAELELARTREQVAVEVAAARSELARARASFDAQRQNAAEAAEAYALAALRFERGLSTQLEASDAQFALLIAQTTEAQTIHDLFMATAELARAEGRAIPLPGGGNAPVRSSSRR